jgi:antitoxin (DNA-binding transcriptional repressor) of toxin-antitoxin stability system
MIAHYNTTHAVQHIQALLREAEESGAVVITKRQQPAAMLVSMDDKGLSRYLKLLVQLAEEPDVANIEPNLRPLFLALKQQSGIEVLRALTQLSEPRPTLAEKQAIVGLWADHGIEGDSGEYLAEMRHKRAQRHDAPPKTAKKKSVKKKSAKGNDDTP